MNSRTIDVVTDWETVPTPAGYEGLRELADREFSGAVSAGPTWAFFLNGRIVGIFEGAVEDFEDADATAYRAADPSLPLLFAMQERGGETRANYYTNETPLRDVDQTLESGGFTGYIELSENVLSGDYYVVYHGGKSMSAAFVGSSERLITGEEAFETAADEVGIYEVVNVDVDLVEIPDPEPEADEGSDTESAGDNAGAAAAAGTGGGAGADASNTSESERGEDSPYDEESEPADAEVDPEPPADGVAGDQLSDDGDVETDLDPDADPDVGPDSDADRDPDPDLDPGAGTGFEGDTAAAVDAAEHDLDEVDDDVAEDPLGREPSADAPETDPAPEEDARPTDSIPEEDASPTDPTVRDSEGEPPAGASRVDAGTESGDRPTGVQPGGSGSSDSALTDEERWQQARTIPSLDPEESTDSRDGVAGNGSGREAARERTAQMQRQRRRRQAVRDRTTADEPDGSTAPSESGGDSGGNSDAVEQYRKRLARARDRIESLEDEREDLLEEREELIGERDRLRSERAEQTERIEELEAECERLRSEVDRLQSRTDAGEGETPSAESMPPDRALSGTNLFVRYNSKGEATLKHAHSGEASRSDVQDNLRLEHHTTFETEGVVVDDRPYEEFLHDSTEYSFAHWVISDLLYEIGETGNRSGLAGVFDAIPDIDRVEIRGEVSVETDDGVEERGFDVVFRDRMGDPLFVADINPSRDATTEAMVGSLVENSHTVASETETVAAGFYVTESFYEPGALETVADRTGGGILSRSSKRSFVKLSRKRGYHLCLVEARDGEFHLNVPEL